MVSPPVGPVEDTATIDMFTLSVKSASVTVNVPNAANPALVSWSGVAVPALSPESAYDRRVVGAVDRDRGGLVHQRAVLVDHVVAEMRRERFALRHRVVGEIVGVDRDRIAVGTDA